MFEIKENLLTTVALDGFRMSVCKKQVNASGDFSAIIPSRTLNEIVRLLEKEEKIKVYIQKNTLLVEFENTIIYSRLIEGEFVKYSHILPTNFENVVTIRREDLLNSIERASIVARNDRYNVGNVNESINISLSGKDLFIAFNGKYILDYLKIINDDFIKINLNSPIDPCIISSMNNEEFLYLILPVRISA